MKSLIIVLLFIPFLIFSQYYTGQRVFSNKFMSEIKYLNQDTYIKIENSNRDIIVAVKDLIKGRVI